MRTTATRPRSAVSSQSVGRNVVPILVGNIRSLVAAWPAADATAAQRRAWRGAVAGLRDELRAGGADGADLVTEPEAPTLQWTALTAGRHTATGSNTLVAHIFPASDPDTDAFVWGVSASSRKLGSGVADSVPEAKLKAQAAVERHHKIKVEAVRSAGAGNSDGGDITWRPIPGGRHVGTDDTYRTSALVKPIPGASGFSWTLTGGVGSSLASGIAPSTREAKAATEKAHDQVFAIRKRLARQS
jgi:hypothetical protein